jgi:hypothetical protein
MEAKYPQIRPKSMNRQGILIYSYKDIPLAQTDDGSQARFLRNNARACHPKEFGLKLYYGKWEAICAYERQKLAAKEGLAPPVGRLIQVHKDNKIKFWGYQTCLAIRLDPDFPMYQRLFPNEETIWKGPAALRRALRKLDISTLPCNDLFHETSDPDNPPVTGHKNWGLGGDLHDFNVMVWEDTPVCIDFGYHSVLTSKRGRISQVNRIP